MITCTYLLHLSPAKKKQERHFIRLWWKREFAQCGVMFPLWQNWLSWIYTCIANYFLYTYNNYQMFLCSSGNLSTCVSTYARTFLLLFDCSGFFSSMYMRKSKTQRATSFVFLPDQAFQLVKGKYSNVNHLQTFRSYSPRVSDKHWSFRHAWECLPPLSNVWYCACVG